MRKLLALIILIYLCIQVQAQKKNEIQIGVTAAYFFDDTPYLFHDFKRGVPLPTHINYSRLLTDKSALSFSFNQLWLVYDAPITYDTPELYLRDYLKLSAEFHRQKRIGKFNIGASIGLGYRFLGGEAFISRSYFGGGYGFSKPYNHVCITAGIQTKFHLYRNLSAVAKINYSRYFSAYSPNELHNIFALSYEF